MEQSQDGLQRRPVVFVTGPYSAPTEDGVRQNIQRAVDTGRIVFSKGYYPVVPHLLVRPYYDPTDDSGDFGYEPLMKYTLALVPRCDMLLLYGHSPGADREWRLAESLGKPVYFDVRDLPDLRKHDHTEG
jgi:hypothetical protein